MERPTPGAAVGQVSYSSTTTKASMPDAPFILRS